MKYSTKIFLVIFLVLGLSTVYADSNDTTDEGFSGRFTFSYAYYTGNTEFSLLKGDLRVEHKRGKFDSVFSLYGDYGQKDDSVYLSKGGSRINTTKNFTKTFAGEIFLDKQFDKFIFLKDRTSTGGGIRITATPSSSPESFISETKVRFGLGLLYEHERFYKDEATNEPFEPNSSLVRSTAYIGLNMTVNDRASLELTGSYQADVEDFDDYRLAIEGRMEIDLFKRLSFFVNSLFRYDNMPPSNLKRHDFQLTNGVIFTF